MVSPSNNKPLYCLLYACVLASLSTYAAASSILSDILAAKNEPAAFSFEIESGESKIDVYEGCQILSQPYHMSNRPYETKILENDCKTPMTDITPILDTIVSARGGFNDIVVKVNITDMVMKKNQKSKFKEDINYVVFCIEIDNYADENKAINVMSDKKHFNISYSLTATFTVDPNKK